MAKKLVTREQIFEVGVRLANSMPPGALTVAAICDELGIVKSTFYRQYRSLKDVFTDILIPVADEALRGIPAIVLGEESNMEKIEALWSLATAKLVEYGPRAMGYTLNFNEPDGHEKYFYEQEPFRGTVIALIERAQKVGETVNQTDPEALFYIMCMYFAGLNMSWAHGDGGFDYSLHLRRGLQGILGVPLPEDGRFQTVPLWPCPMGEPPATTE